MWPRGRTGVLSHAGRALSSQGARGSVLYIDGSHHHTLSFTCPFIDSFSRHSLGATGHLLCGSSRRGPQAPSQGCRAQLGGQRWRGTNA